MSEFSDSYHLRTKDPVEVSKLLRAARRHGAVLPTTTRYVPFLVDGRQEAGSAIEDVVAHNPGVLVHYCYGEDHGMWMRVFDRSTHVSTIEIPTRRALTDDLPDPKTTTTALTAIGAVPSR